MGGDVRDEDFALYHWLVKYRKTAVKTGARSLSRPEQMERQKLRRRVTYLERLLRERDATE
jgi:hypothetical protein